MITTLHNHDFEAKDRPKQRVVRNKMGTIFLTLSSDIKYELTRGIIIGHISESDSEKKSNMPGMKIGSIFSDLEVVGGELYDYNEPMEVTLTLQNS